MGLSSSLLGMLALPPAFVLGRVHRMLTGRSAILDVTVEPVGGLEERERFRRRLRRAAEDPGVVGILLRLREPPGGWSVCQDLRLLVTELRQKGKKVYAYLESPGNALMAIASVCDRVFAVPTGEVGLVGVGIELTFFGHALGRLGVTPDFEAAGAYKSFGEPFTRSFPSPANQEAMRELVDDLHDQLLVAVADGRGKPVEAVRAVFAQAPLSAGEALDAGLVDELLYEDQLEGWLEEHHGKPAKLVSWRGWALRDRWLERLLALGATGKKVAVVHLEGNIVVDGSGRTLAARKVVPLIRKLRDDDEIAAVVLHVNSPGGSALASDLMWREVDVLGRKKPVVAAFADVAASGGVYLAAPAREIFVRPGTLTGSIGVFGGKLVVADGFRQLGVHTHAVEGAPNAALYSASRPFSPEQRVRFKASLQRFYDGFVGRVATGRKKAVEAVEPHCRGRVWTGRAAVDRGLVDHTGGLDAAIERARDLAELRSSRWRRVDVSGRDDPPWARVLQLALHRVVPSSRAVRWVGERLLSPSLEVLLAHPAEPLAMLEFEFEVR